MKKRLAIIFGSRTCEHDVSIITGLQAVGAADKSKYDAFPVYIARDGAWYTGEKLRDIGFYSTFDPDQVRRVLPMGEKGKLVLIALPTSKKKFFAAGREDMAVADIVLPVMHGMNGEDGTLQGMLELWDVPFTSSGVLGASVGMDKIMMRKVFAFEGLPVLPGLGFTRAQWAAASDQVIEQVEKELGYPVYIKPSNLGSSIGISRASDREGLRQAMDIASAYDRRILVERGVEKRKEVNCSVLGYGEYALTSTLEMPITSKELLTYDEKYPTSSEDSGSKGMQSLSRQIPAPISEEMTAKIKEMSLKAFEALDCKGVVRIDYLIDEADGNVYIGEINTIPGSLAFYLWEAEGLSFPQLIDEMVSCAESAAAEKRASVYSYDSEILKKQKSGKLGSKAGGTKR